MRDEFFRMSLNENCLNNRIGHMEVTIIKKETGLARILIKLLPTSDRSTSRLCIFMKIISINQILLPLKNAPVSLLKMASFVSQERNYISCKIKHPEKSHTEILYKFTGNGNSRSG